MTDDKRPESFKKLDSCHNCKHYYLSYHHCSAHYYDDDEFSCKKFGFEFYKGEARSTICDHWEQND